MSNYGQKTNMIYLYLDMDINMKTSDIIKSMLDDGITVSKRQVQRVRKEYKKALKKERENELIFSKLKIRKEVAEMGRRISDENIMLINMANEGDWTIQELAKELNRKSEDIRNSLREYHWMIQANILDDESENAYFNPDETPVNEKEDVFDSKQDKTPTNEEEDVFDSKQDETPTNEEEDVFDSKQDETPTNEEEDLIDVQVDEFTKQLGINTGSGGDGDFWEIEIETVTACSKCSKSINVFVNNHARNKALMYMKWAGAREWLAYLVGEFKNNSYYVYDLYLPDQRTCSTLVDKVSAEKYNKMKIIGVIHSHHEMGAGDEDNPSFSGHDAAFINGNHNLSLLAGRDRKSSGFKIVGIARVKTPCGSFMKVKAKVKAMDEIPADVKKEMKKEFLEKTQTQVHAHVNSSGYPNNTCATSVTRNNHGRTYHFNGTGNGYPANQIPQRQTSFNRQSWNGRNKRGNR